MNKYIYPILILLSIVFPILFINDPYILHLAILSCINIILATSMQLIMTTGLLNLSHAAFMSIGAYCSSFLVKNLGLSFWLSLPISGILGALIAFVLGLIVLRTRGAYFFIITFAFAEIVIIFFNNFFIPLFGGPAGIVGVPPPNPISFFDIGKVLFTSKLNLYYLILAIVFIIMGVIIRINKTRVGMICKGLEQAEVLSESIGVDTFKYSLIIFILGCFFATIAGSLYAHTIYVVTPYDFDVHISILIVLWVVIGGKNHYFGPVIGVVLLTILSELLRELGHFELLGYSVALILIMRLMPGGLITLPEKAMSFIGR
ncbi:branched-chain amino acid ABC transporter permease [bacterium]|nr:branched-chain amino acid ABC transporter permease [bacterium]